MTINKYILLFKKIPQTCSRFRKYGTFVFFLRRAFSCYFEVKISAAFLERPKLRTMLCFDLLTRPKMPFKVMHRKEVTHSDGSYERKSRGRKLADDMERAKKIPMVHYRVMHRKRVTSELHDSYFRLMTIKHSISKIEWASNDYIIELSSSAIWRRDVVGKATPGRRGSG